MIRSRYLHKIEIMSCPNCQNSHCCGSSKGERGLQGPVGPQGPTGPAGPAGGGIVNKINFYAQFISDIQVSTGLPDPAIYHHPVGYDILSWENTTTDPIIIYAHGTWDQTMQLNNVDDMSNWVDGALILTSIGGVDSVLWESEGDWDLRGSLFDGLTVNDSIKIGSIPETVQSTPGGNQVEFRFGASNIPQNKSINTKVTVAPGEKLSLKFKTKSIATLSLLNKAQLFMQQLDM
jgi:hypothetical protein